jgi:peptidoglycan/LPS O-acetylase OafA/YrhL
MLLFFVRTGLPGVFNDNPMSGAFNGPLWTLPWELLAYAMTFGLFAAGVLRDKRVLVGLWVLLAVLYYYPLQSLGNTSYVRWLLCYATGSLCCVLQWPDRLRSWHVMITLGLCVLFAILKTPLYHLAALVLLAQVLLWVGMRAPTIVHLRADISYGVYIYAWPIQQILVQEIPGINAWQVAGLTGAIVVPLALASWYFVEKPMLGKKDRFAGWLEQRSNRLYCFSRNKIGG